VTLQVANDNVKQDTQNGAKCLTHQTNGQQPDSLSGTLPFTITGGSGNPNPALRGQTITASDSLVTVPIYNGSSSSSCSDNDNGRGGCLVTANITGFMQLFIRNVDDDDQGRVQTTIMNISSCGGSSDVITGGGLSPVAVRLVF
jgi:hypothetical protein